MFSLWALKMAIEINNEQGKHEFVLNEEEQIWSLPCQLLKALLKPRMNAKSESRDQKMQKYSRKSS